MCSPWSSARLRRLHDHTPPARARVGRAGAGRSAPPGLVPTVHSTSPPVPALVMPAQGDRLLRWPDLPSTWNSKKCCPFSCLARQSVYPFTMLANALNAIYDAQMRSQWHHVGLLVEATPPTQRYTCPYRRLCFFWALVRHHRRCPEALRSTFALLCGWPLRCWFLTSSALLAADPLRSLHAARCSWSRCRAASFHPCARVRLSRAGAGRNLGWSIGYLSLPCAALLLDVPRNLSRPHAVRPVHPE